MLAEAVVCIGKSLMSVISIKALVTNFCHNQSILHLDQYR